MSSKRAAVIELYKQGQGVNNVARLLQMHKQSVSRMVSRFKELGTLEDRSRSGRPPDTFQRLREMPKNMASVQFKIKECSAIAGSDFELNFAQFLVKKEKRWNGSSSAYEFVNVNNGELKLLNVSHRAFGAMRNI